MKERQRTIKQERARLEMAREIDKTLLFSNYQSSRGDIVPPGWAMEAMHLEEMQPKTRVSLMLDDDVAKWFRQHGAGYQERMNSVLRLFMLNVIAKEEEGYYDRSFGEGKPL